MRYVLAATVETFVFRQPYAGELVFTAFSGSHQDAISKSLKHYAAHGGVWNIPYLPIDPCDIGRTYQSVIRINSQSGKGGAAYVLEKHHNLLLPPEMYPELGEAIKAVTSINDRELSPDDIFTVFMTTFCDIPGPFTIIDAKQTRQCTSGYNEKTIESPYGLISVECNPDTLIENLQRFFNQFGIDIKIVRTKSEPGHSQEISNAAFVQVSYKSMFTQFGASLDADRTGAIVRATCSALNRMNTWLECAKSN